MLPWQPNYITLIPLVLNSLSSLVSFFSCSLLFLTPQFLPTNPFLPSYLPFYSLFLVGTQIITFPSFPMWSPPLSKILSNLVNSKDFFKTCTWSRMVLGSGFSQGTNNVWEPIQVLIVTPSVIPNPFIDTGLSPVQ